MILSDRDIKQAIEEGRISIEPFDIRDVQPSSIDLHVDRFFRVFHNARYPYIDVKQPMEGLTEELEVTDDEPFILHPGEFVLGSTLEYVKLPNDLVARLEGKSSLGRLGLLIHSSLPGSEEVLFHDGGTLKQRRIDDIVNKRLEGHVVSFDPQTFAIGYHAVTGWHEFPPDRVFEVRLASGRSVRLTGGHDLFTLDRDGELSKTRVHELSAGTQVAIPGTIPDLREPSDSIDIVKLAPEAQHDFLVCGGPTVAEVVDRDRAGVSRALTERGLSASYYVRKGHLPLPIAREFGVHLGPQDWVAWRGSRTRLPAIIEVDSDVAWLLGLYVAEGHRRERQITISNTDQDILDRAEHVFQRLGQRLYRSAGAVTCCSALMANLVAWLGSGEHARKKRIPNIALGWSHDLIGSFLEGFMDGDGSREETRVSLWTSSDGLAGDLLLVCCRLSKRAGAHRRSNRQAWQISLPHAEHKLLTAVPLPDKLLVDLRTKAGLDQKTAAQTAGFRYATQLNNLERRRETALRRSTLRRLRDAYRPASSEKADRLVDGDLCWDRIVEVRDTGEAEPVFDLEVRPNGVKIENFVAGRGGVFVSNTAGYVDPGFEGHLTLELSNVANLPITIYPKMKIGQISFFQLTSEAEHPYGSGEVGSKYQGQRGPTASRYFKNFEQR